MAGEAYVDPDMQYADLIKNLVSPPDEGQQSGTSEPQQVTSTLPPTPADEPANPTLKTRPQAVQRPVQQAQPAAPAVPATVTPNGNGTPPAVGQRDWGYYAQRSMQGGLDAAAKQQSAVDPILNQPTAEDANAKLIEKRAAYAQPLDPNAQTPSGKPLYKPGIGTRIVRGIDAVRRGGVLGVVDPADVGGTAYGAPTRQFGIDSARRQQNAAAIDQQLKQMDEARKSDTDRMGKIGLQEKDVATAYSDVGKNASAQETAENNADKVKMQGDLNDIKQQLADQGGVPKTYEQGVFAAAFEKDPARKAALTQAAKTIAATEVKKFQYAARAAGDPYDERRQTMIDKATSDVEKYNTYQWDPDANDGRGAFFDASNPDSKKVYTPEEFTNLKNAVAIKLDKDLAAKKLRPLGVRFNVKATTPGGRSQAAPAAPQAAPKAAPTAPAGATHVYKDKSGNVAGWAVNGKFVPVGAP